MKSTGKPDTKVSFSNRALGACLLGAMLVLFGAAPSGAQVLTLPEALDQPTWEFTTSGDADWYATDYWSHDGWDMAASDLSSASMSSTLQTVRTFEAGYLSFWWYTDVYGSGNIRFFLDDMAVPVAEYSGWNWQRQIFAVPAGEHTLRWVAQSGDSEIYAYLDEVVSTAEPPDIVVTVGVSGADSAPEILVDTADLDGNQNEASSWFTRRYAFDASSQVRFTAPARQGSYAFSRWDHCDATEGTGGETCVVDRKMDKSINAQYVFRPALAEALDQPAWEFATSGDSTWYGANNWSHDGVDSAQTDLSVAYRSSTLQTVRTFEAGYFSFWWLADAYGSGKIMFFLDDMAVPVAEYSGYWQRQIFAVTAGEHTLRWVAQSGDSVIHAYLDEVAFTTEPPDIAVTVGVYGIDSAPEILVDTADLDGNQNEASGWFTRRYAFDASSQVRFTAPARQGSYAFSRWDHCDATEGTGGETCVVDRKTDKSISAQYVFRPALAEALDQPAWEFATSGAAEWYGTGGGHDGVDAATSSLFLANTSATLQTVRTFEAGYVSFWWGASVYGSAKFEFFLDDLTVPVAVYGGAPYYWDWQQRIFAVTAGEHTLRWVAQSGNSGISAYLDEVVFTADPPDITVSVGVNGVNPAPEIAVDTADLDGNQNATTYSFTRRYSYSASSPVRFTAPGTQGSYVFSGWNGCDAIEGAGGATCVVNLTLAKTITAQYLFRPPLAEALDQPTWEFATSGDFAWYGTGYGHDEWDSAESDLPAPGKSATLQTVRTFEAGFVSFWWAADNYGSGKVQFFLDDLSAPAAEYSGGNWQRRTFAVTAGEHTLRWVAESGNSEIYAYLDEVVFTADPPDVTVSVGVNYVVPAPEIVVDTVDLDGNQNATSSSFTRRYSYSASSQVRFTVPAAQGSYVFSRWSGCDATEGVVGETCVVSLTLAKTISAQYLFRLPLAEALDQPTWEFTTSGSGVWYGTGYGHDESDSAESDLLSPGQTAALQTVRTFEAGYVSFWWAADNYGSGKVQFFLDDLSAPAAEYSGGNWQRRIFAVTAGEHTLRWVAESGNSEIYAYLDEVVFTADAPDVTVSVGVYNVVPAPEIVVDTVDLDGDQNATSSSFTRRYSYSTSSQVRFTAPAIQGSYTFSRWIGCDAIEGTDGRTCAVSLILARSINAQYLFRPPLAEALDQPTWEFTTSGNPTWYGTDAWPHDGWDSAQADLASPDKSAAIQTVRTFEAGYLSFWWVGEAYGSGKVAFFLDELTVPLAEYGGGTWQQRIFPVTAGEHTLRWVAESGNSEAYANLDEVVFSLAPPDVTVSVQVSGVNPAPEIVVDTPDLAGYQNGTSYSFMRRYAYNGASQVRFTAPLAGGPYQFSRWTGCDATEGTGGETCVVNVDAGKSISAQYVYRPPLAEALDQPTWLFTTSGDSAWYGADYSSHDGEDSAQTDLLLANTTAAVQTVRTFEAGYVSFWWSTETYGSGKVRFFLDGLSVPAAEYSGWNWQQRIFPVTAGEHTLRWVAESGDSQFHAYLDEVVFSATPPDVLVSVAVYGVSPAPEIVVDTVDLDGNQNATSSRFWRRYAYNAASQVRLTAPPVQGAFVFAFWSGCDATEGAGGETCLVGLNGGKSVSAQYAYRPSLAEALDQPTWEFATSGDPAWAGTDGVTHDGVDAANLFQSAAGQSSTIQTVRTLEVGYLSFWWSADIHGSGKVTFFLDDMAVPAAEYNGWNWQQRILPVTAGEHTLRWVAESGDASYLQARLDEVAFSAAPPTVVVSVGSMLAGDVAVDTPDLDGNGNGRPWFTRRYAYAASGQVRFTALQGANEFASWFGCDAVEGTSGEVCVVGLDGGREVIVDYRPRLPVALDQPSWEFATTGDSLWHGENNGHDLWDDARSDLSSPGMTSTVETVRTLAAGHLSFWWRAFTSGSGKITFLLDGTALAEYSGSGWLQRVFPVTAGEHTLRWIAESGDSHISAYLDEVVVSAEPPEVVIGVGASVPVVIAVDTPDLDGFTNGTAYFTRRYGYSVSTLVRFTAPLSHGPSGFSAWSGCDATEGPGNATCVVSLQGSRTVTAFYGGNTPPVLEAVGGKSVDEGQKLSFTLTATDADGDALTYSSSALPAGAALDAASGVFVWTPGYAQAGSYPITFTVTDDGSPNLTDTETVTITVHNVNRAPVLEPVGGKSTPEGSPLQFTLAASDPDSGSLTFSASGLPVGATLDATTGGFLWTPGYDQAASYVVTFTVSDGELTDAEAITITVTDTNRAPDLAAVGDRTVTEGRTLAFTVAATDPDGDLTAVAAEGLPSTAIFDATAGAFSWRPGYYEGGEYAVTFRAVDDGTPQRSSEETIIIRVVPPVGPIFSDNFADGAAASDWRKLSGSWTSGGGVFTSTSLTKDNLVRIVPLDPTHSPLGAGVLQAKVKLTATAASTGPNAIMFFGFLDVAHYRWVKVTKSQVQIGQTGSIGVIRPGIKKWAPRSLAVGRYITITVKVFPDGWVKVYQGTAKTPVVSYRFLAAGRPDVVKGGAGLAAAKAKTIFDNVQVWEDSALKP